MPKTTSNAATSGKTDAARAACNPTLKALITASLKAHSMAQTADNIQAAVKACNLYGIKGKPSADIARLPKNQLAAAILIAYAANGGVVKDMRQKTSLYKAAYAHTTLPFAKGNILCKEALRGVAMYLHVGEKERAQWEEKLLALTPKAAAPIWRQAFTVIAAYKGIKAATVKAATIKALKGKELALAAIKAA